MSRRRWPGRDRGSFTAELAAGLPALMLLLLAALSMVSAMLAKSQCLDAAREAALAAARGEPARQAAERVAPPGARIELGGDTGTVTAVVSARVRVLGGDLPGI